MPKIDYHRMDWCSIKLSFWLKTLNYFPIIAVLACSYWQPYLLFLLPVYILMFIGNKREFDKIAEMDKRDDELRELAKSHGQKVTW